MPHRYLSIAAPVSVVSICCTRVQQGAVDREPGPVPAQPALEVDRRTAPGREVGDRPDSCSRSGTAAEPPCQSCLRGVDAEVAEHELVWVASSSRSCQRGPCGCAGGHGGPVGGGRGRRRGGGERRCRRRRRRRRGRRCRRDAAGQQPGQRALHGLDVHPVAVVEHPQPERPASAATPPGCRRSSGSGSGRPSSRAGPRPARRTGSCPGRGPSRRRGRRRRPPPSAGGMAAPPEGGQPAAGGPAAAAARRRPAPPARAAEPGVASRTWDGWGWWDGTGPR